MIETAQMTNGHETLSPSQQLILRGFRLLSDGITYAVFDGDYLVGHIAPDGKFANFMPLRIGYLSIAEAARLKASPEAYEQRALGRSVKLVRCATSFEIME